MQILKTIIHPFDYSGTNKTNKQSRMEIVMVDGADVHHIVAIDNAEFCQNNWNLNEFYNALNTMDYVVDHLRQTVTFIAEQIAPPMICDLIYGNFTESVKNKESMKKGNNKLYFKFSMIPVKYIVNEFQHLHVIPLVPFYIFEFDKTLESPVFLTLPMSELNCRALHLFIKIYNFGNANTLYFANNKEFADNVIVIDREQYQPQEIICIWISRQKKLYARALNDTQKKDIQKNNNKVLFKIYCMESI